MAMKNLYIFEVWDHYTERVIVAADYAEQAQDLFERCSGFSKALSVECIDIETINKPQII